jgi:hypothetical protein
MGEYWKPVNLTKLEYIHPHDLNCGLKIGEWNSPGSRVMKLIDKRWGRNDVIVAVSDYDNVHAIRGEAAPDDVPKYDSLDDNGLQRVTEATPK